VNNQITPADPMRHLRWVRRWAYSLALYAFLQMSVWTLSLVLAGQRYAAAPRTY